MIFKQYDLSNETSILSQTKGVNIFLRTCLKPPLLACQNVLADLIEMSYT